MTRVFLVFPATDKGGSRLEAEHDVEPKRPILDIEDIQPVLVLEIEIRPASHLGHAGDARLDGEEAPMVLAVLLDFALLMRPRSHEAHFAAEHIEELRQLIERETLDERADARLSRVVFDLIERSFADAPLGDQLLLIGERRLEIRIGLIDAPLPLHVAEFEDRDPLPVLADTLIGVDDRTIWILELDEARDHKHHRGEEDGQPEPGHDIERALQNFSPAVQGRMQELDHRLTIPYPHRETRGLECGREVFVGDIIDLAIVEELLLFIIGQGRITDDNLVDPFARSDLLDPRHACRIHLVNNLVAERFVPGEESLERIHALIGTDEEQSMDPNSATHKKPALDALDDEPSGEDIDHRQEPADENDEAGREPFTLKEDRDHEDDESDRNGPSDPRKLLP